TSGSLSTDSGLLWATGALLGGHAPGRPGGTGPVRAGDRNTCDAGLGVSQLQHRRTGRDRRRLLRVAAPPCRRDGPAAERRRPAPLSGISMSAVIVHDLFSTRGDISGGSPSGPGNR